MRRLSTAAVLVMITTMLAACASTTNGTGNGSADPATPTVGTPIITAVPSTSAIAPTTAAATIVPVTSTGPSPVDPPAICASGGCKKHKTADVGDGYAVTLYGASDPSGAVSSTVLELTHDGTSLFWQVTKEQIAGDLVCSPQPAPNCVVVAGVGAHASIASGYTRQVNQLVKYAEVPSDTPSTDPADLNGDGIIDVVTAINTYEPSYATGKVYWQTFQSTGTSFESTGCTKPQFNLPPEPSAPLTGVCPS